MTFEPLTVVAVVLYASIVLGIGWMSIRRVKSTRDYLIAGDGFGRWVVSFGVVGAVLSGASLLGNAGSGYGVGYSLYVMTLGLSFLGLTAAYFILAKPMTVIAKRHEVYTLPDVLALRYGDSKAVRMLSALAVVLGCYIYLVVQFVAIAYVGVTIFGWSPGFSILAGGLFVVLYSVGGGIVATMWANLFQMIVLGVFAIGIAVYGVMQVGGFTELHSRMEAIDPELTAPWRESGAFVWQNVLTYAFFVGLLAYAGVPHINTKFLTIRNVEVIRWLPFISCFLYLGGIAAVWAGMSYRVLQEQDGSLPVPAEPDAVLPTLVLESFGPFIVGVLVAAGLAAVMHTAASFMVLSSAAVIRDIGKEALGWTLSDRQEKWAIRGFAVVFMILAGLLALNPPDFVLALMAVAWGALAAMLGPVLYLGMRWKRATSQGAVAALVVGIAIGGVTGVLNQTLSSEDPIFSPWNVAAVGVAASYVTLVVISLLTKPQPSKVFAHFGTGGRPAAAPSDRPVPAAAGPATVAERHEGGSPGVM